MQPKVSIIVSTYNGEKKISVLMAALQSQTFTDFELIVIIDGSTDSTKQILEEIKTTFSKKIIAQPNRGRAIVKNNGAQLAGGDILIFYDDDMEPNPDSVQSHIDFHENHYGLLSGNSIERESKAQTDIQNYKAKLTQQWTKKYQVGLNQLDKSNLFFSAANCSMLKKTFNLLGGFDSRLTDAEDFELACRALNRGIPVFFDKSNSAIHHDRVTCSSYISRTKQYRAAHQKLLEFNPPTSDGTAQELPVLKSVFYWFFHFDWWPMLIDKYKILLIFPMKIRYKIYDWVIYSHGVIN